LPELPDGSRVARPPSRRLALPRWAVLPAAVVLIAVVALASRSTSTPPVELSFDSSPLIGAMQVAGYVAEFVGLAGLLAAMIFYRARTMRAQAPAATKRRPPPMPWWAQLLGLLAVAAIVVGQIAVIVAYVFEILRAMRTRIGGGAGGGQSPFDLSPGLAGRDTASLVIAVVIFIGLLVLLLAIAIRWRLQDRRFAIAGPDAYRAAAEAAVDVSLDALRGEPDPRRAVIAAYAAMERALSAAGLGRHRSEAPLEYVRRVLTEHTHAPAEVRTITDLFQVAKFSQHPVDEGMRANAIGALERIRSATAVPA
jgi:hypothetical protein